MLLCELVRCEYIERRENVLFVGNPGTGKTHLAIALAMAACARGYRVRFYRLTELATLLMEARDERGLLGLKARLAKLDLLVLDELGYVPASKVGAELLFDVISSAYERTSLIVTTNVPFECVFRSKPNTDSTASRTPIPEQAEHRFRSKPNRL
jgi:DNA replication protein DnaC